MFQTTEMPNPELKKIEKKTFEHDLRSKKKEFYHMYIYICICIYMVKKNFNVATDNIFFFDAGFGLPVV